MDTHDRREMVRDLVVSGAVDGPKDIARELADAGVEVDADILRGDLRALGAVRVAGADGPTLAILVDRAHASATAHAEPVKARKAPGRLAAEVTSDPDWPLQAVVAAVAGAFLLVAVLVWAIGPH